MNLQPPLLGRLATTVVVALAFMPPGIVESQTQPPIVQPGAPGNPSRQISAEEASDLAGIQLSDADVKFMQGMISHHAQAIEMTQLLASRSERDVMHRLAQRIEISQEDEIAMMQGWLRSRDQEVIETDAYRAPGAERMPGMVTEEEMDRLEQAQAIDFDRLFLELMVAHHQGALTMVENLLSQRGTAQDSQLFAFTSDITADQSMEIDRMDAMLAGLSAAAGRPQSGLSRRRSSGIEHGAPRGTAKARGLLRPPRPGRPTQAQPA